MQNAQTRLEYRLNEKSLRTGIEALNRQYYKTPEDVQKKAILESHLRKLTRKLDQQRREFHMVTNSNNTYNEATIVQYKNILDKYHLLHQSKKRYRESLKTVVEDKDGADKVKVL